MRIGIIGTGWIAEKHLESLTVTEGAEVVAVAGRNQQRAAELAVPLGAAVYEDYLPMLQRESLDAVFILLPPHLHGDVERACSEHVGAVLVEKPITTSLAQACEINSYFKEAGTIVSVGYMNRYRDAVQAARAVFSNPETPGVMANGWWITQMPPPSWWRCLEQSGGQFVEQCTHLVDLSRYLFGEIQEVSAYSMRGSMTEVPDFSVDDGMAVNVRFESGALGSFCTGCFPLAGHPEEQGAGISLNLSSRKQRVVFEGSNFEAKLFSGANDATELPIGADPFHQQTQSFVNAVRNKDTRQILSDYEDAMRTLAVTLAANESAHERGGAPVRVESIL